MAARGRSRTAANIIEGRLLKCSRSGFIEPSGQENSGLEKGVSTAHV
jgi:hypothetical protein